MTSITETRKLMKQFRDDISKTCEQSPSYGYIIINDEYELIEDLISIIENNHESPYIP
jgi:hypothetical protein